MEAARQRWAIRGEPRLSLRFRHLFCLAGVAVGSRRRRTALSRHHAEPSERGRPPHREQLPAARITERIWTVISLQTSECAAAMARSIRSMHLVSRLSSHLSSLSPGITASSFLLILRASPQRSPGISRSSLPGGQMQHVRVGRHLVVGRHRWTLTGPWSTAGSPPSLERTSAAGGRRHTRA